MLDEIKVGDEVRIIGEKSDNLYEVEKIYTGIYHSRYGDIVLGNRATISNIFNSCLEVDVSLLIKQINWKKRLTGDLK